MGQLGRTLRLRLHRIVVSDVRPRGRASRRPKLWPTDFGAWVTFMTVFGIVANIVFMQRHNIDAWARGLFTPPHADR